MDTGRLNLATLTFTQTHRVDKWVPASRFQALEQRAEYSLIHKDLLVPRLTRAPDYEPSVLIFDNLTYDDTGIQISNTVITDSAFEKNRQVVRKGRIQKINCAYFRNKRAVLKISNVKISFEISDSI